MVYKLTSEWHTNFINFFRLGQALGCGLPKNGGTLAPQFFWVLGPFWGLFKAPFGGGGGGGGTGVCVVPCRN